MRLFGWATCATAETVDSVDGALVAQLDGVSALYQRKSSKWFAECRLRILSPEISTSAILTWYRTLSHIAEFG